MAVGAGGALSLQLPLFSTTHTNTYRLGLGSSPLLLLSDEHNRVESGDGSPGWKWKDWRQELTDGSIFGRQSSHLQWMDTLSKRNTSVFESCFCFFLFILQTVPVVLTIQQDEWGRGSVLQRSGRRLHLHRTQALPATPRHWLWGPGHCLVRGCTFISMFVNMLPA